jgi:hypothetical protein
VTREEALKLITALPPETKLFIRTGQFMDDAYPVMLRAFNESGGITAYFDIDREKTGEHRNWPEPYSGAIEIFPVEDEDDSEPGPVPTRK